MKEALNKFVRDLTKVGSIPKSEAKRRIKELLDKYGDAHGYKGVGYKGISAWISEGKKYQFWDYIDSKMLIEFRDRTHKIGSHGAVTLVGKNGDICAECLKKVKRDKK